MSKQGKAQPVLLVAAEDWRELKRPEATHEGAFGSDFARVLKREIQSAKVGTHDPRGEQWWAVWKFPGDLNDIDGFLRIADPLPVGSYPLWSDGWWAPPTPVSFSELPVNDDAGVEKMRMDVTSPAVHYLQGENGQCAMISTHYFIDGFWETDVDTTNIVSMLTALHDECGVYAFSCYGQHHAIVLYGDLSAGTPVLLTPRRLAVAMQTLAKKTKIVDALSLGTRDPDRKADLREWANNYIQAFESGA